jgi:hypothetical protein
MPSMNRILLIVAAVCFGLAALSAFSDAINVNELGFVALGLLAQALSPLLAEMAVGTGGGPLWGRRYVRR